MVQPIPINHARVMKEGDFIVSKTDLKGRITYGNQIFIEMSGYTEHELLGSPHSIIRHPDMPKAVFKLLWSRIVKKEEIFAFVKNLSKDGSYYWVYANVTASVDENGRIIGYYSVRRKPKESAVDVISSVYQTMLEKEEKSGVSESMAYLTQLLEEKGVSYDELIISLQH